MFATQSLMLKPIFKSKKKFLKAGHFPAITNDKTVYYMYLLITVLDGVITLVLQKGQVVVLATQQPRGLA